MNSIKFGEKDSQIIARLSDENLGQLTRALFRRFVLGEDVDASTLGEAAGLAYDAICRKADIAEKRAAAGRRSAEKRGGSVPGKAAEQVAPVALVAQVTPVVSIADVLPEAKAPIAKKRTAPRFVPPTVDEVRAYCEQRKNNIDPEAFVAFYESKGWRVGQTPMKRWQSAIITWEKRSRAEAGGRPTKTVTAQQYEQRDYSGVQDEMLERQRLEIEAKLRAKQQGKRVLAQMYEQRDYSGVQAELMAQQDREMEEFMAKQREEQHGTAQAV